MPKRSQSGAAPNRVVVELQVTHPDPAYQVYDRRAENRIREEKLSKNRAALCSRENPYGGGAGMESFESADHMPDDLEGAFRDARKWEQKSLLMQVLVALKIGFYNYGFALRPVERPLDEAKKEALRKWQRLNRRKIRALVKETWQDRVVTDNVIAFWREKAGVVIPRVIMVPAERCIYSDAMGIEKLKVNLGWNETDLRTGKPGEPQDRTRDPNRLTAKEIKRYAASRYVELSEDEGEFFRVLKRSRTGWGFTLPRMTAVFRTMAQDESMQVADNLWAFLSRAVTRHFKIGHEIRNGPLAGRGTWFWDPVRDAALREFFEGKVGILDVSTNFDVAIEFPYPDGKRFEREKYLSVFERLSTWAGPTGMMLLNNKGNGNPEWLKLLRIEATEERDDVGPYLSEIVNTVFKPPMEVEVSWKNTIFQDQRMAVELLKFLTTTGALSYRTALDEASFDPDQEREHKAEEAELIQDPEKKYLLLPPFDPAHGEQPGQGKNTRGRGNGTGEPGGRPAGTGNSGPRQA